MVVLVVEDNRALAANMIEFLEAYGFECDYADNGALGFKLAMNQSFNAIILDIMMPEKDGMTLCTELRQAGVNTPVLMLTARDTLDDKLQGFEAGADDYLVKPFDLPELVARVKVLTKRFGKNDTRLNVFDLVMDIDLREVTRSGKKIELNKASWQILEALMKTYPKVVTRQQIEQIIWPDQLPDSDVLKSHIYKLRQVVDKPFGKSLIQTVRGVGLVLKHEHDSDIQGENSEK
ncbi:response regulator transcription factor [Pseudocolwellia sp. AS88]|uniref:response regulator transcription factor n=1 Tax=Pseudocolwellia sp. AS88 TaxID=3063958 RepID=UPI0026EA8D00|nr:response regulator transcription factor [Pseudocolwellia sp. AS88]MDO7084181.1 response regulator transcription factor [Pseudocolwellia sp. AS88]